MIDNVLLEKLFDYDFDDFENNSALHLDTDLDNIADDEIRIEEFAKKLNNARSCIDLDIPTFDVFLTDYEYVDFIRSRKNVIKTKKEAYDEYVRCTKMEKLFFPTHRCEYYGFTAVEDFVNYAKDLKKNKIGVYNLAIRAYKEKYIEQLPDDLDKHYIHIRSFDPSNHSIELLADFVEIMYDFGFVINYHLYDCKIDESFFKYIVAKYAEDNVQCDQSEIVFTKCECIDSSKAYMLDMQLGIHINIVFKLCKKLPRIANCDIGDDSKWKSKRMLLGAMLAKYELDSQDGYYYEAYIADKPGKFVYNPTYGNIKYKSDNFTKDQKYIAYNVMNFEGYSYYTIFFNCKNGKMRKEFAKIKEDIANDFSSYEKIGYYEICNNIKKPLYDARYLLC